MTTKLRDIINMKTYEKELIFSLSSNVSYTEPIYILYYMLFIIVQFPDESKCVSQIFRQIIKIIYSLRDNKKSNIEYNDVINLLSLLADIIHDTTVIRNVF
jgi:hypothetical protein